MTQTFGRAVLGAAVGLAVFYAFTSFTDLRTADTMQQLSDQVAADYVSQYEIVKRQGDAMQTCVQAGVVSAAYLQAKDEPNYAKWKRVEAEDCQRAGLPR